MTINDRYVQLVNIFLYRCRTCLGQCWLGLKCKKIGRNQHENPQNRPLYNCALQAGLMHAYVAMHFFQYSRWVFISKNLSDLHFVPFGVIIGPFYGPKKTQMWFVGQESFIVMSPCMHFFCCSGCFHTRYKLLDIHFVPIGVI